MRWSLCTAIVILALAAGHETRAAQGELLSKRYFHQEPLFVEPGVKTGLSIRYENPTEVGADRIVNGLAARELYGAPVVVADFGTATTFDVVNAEGEYAGGGDASSSQHAAYRSTGCKLLAATTVGQGPLLARTSIANPLSAPLAGRALGRHLTARAIGERAFVACAREIRRIVAVVAIPFASGCAYSAALTLVSWT